MHSHLTPIILEQGCLWLSSPCRFFQNKTSRPSKSMVARHSCWRSGLCRERGPAGHPSPSARCCWLPTWTFPLAFAARCLESQTTVWEAGPHQQLVFCRKGFIWKTATSTLASLRRQRWLEVGIDPKARTVYSSESLTESLWTSLEQSSLTSAVAPLDSWNCLETETGYKQTGTFTRKQKNDGGLLRVLHPELTLPASPTTGWKERFLLQLTAHLQKSQGGKAGFLSSWMIPGEAGRTSETRGLECLLTLGMEGAQATSAFILLYPFSLCSPNTVGLHFIHIWITQT